MAARKRERVEQTSHKVIEKRRRDRINNCLFELSQTVPAAFSKQSSGKLEKAEILEMTVEYLRAVQSTEIGMRFDNGEWFSADIWGDFAQHYQTGYSECAREVLKYMADVEGVALSDTRCARLISFLHNRFRSDVLTSAGNGNTTAVGAPHPPPPPPPPPHPPSLPIASSLGNAGNSGSHVGSYVTTTSGSSSNSRGGGGGLLAGMVMTSASPARDVTGLLNSVKTVTSDPRHGGGGGGGSSGFDTRLMAFSPYIPPPPLPPAAVTGSAADSGRSPLHALPASGVSPPPPPPPRGGPGAPLSSVIPPGSASSPFRPLLPALTIPAVDYLRFPPTVSFLPRTPGGLLPEGVLSSAKDSAAAAAGAGGFCVAPLPGLAYASFRKDVHPGVG